jgi:predicted 2-oxoglutarate/Fe(II)-dependent dioxygenase YbiX
VQRRIVPEIQKIHQFTATRMERYLVGCYRAGDQGHFEPHRDNTTKGTAHRRFAVSINLNADYDGGELGFPEYGPQLFKPPVGGAVVFSCSMLHRATTVTRGDRYAFLPFLYDEAAAKLREENLKFVDMPGAQAAEAEAS